MDDQQRLARLRQQQNDAIVAAYTPHLVNLLRGVLAGGFQPVDWDSQFTTLKTLQHPNIREPIEEWMLYTVSQFGRPIYYQPSPELFHSFFGGTNNKSNFPSLSSSSTLSPL
jgi:hypothetical protein